MSFSAPRPHPHEFVPNGLAAALGSATSELIADQRRAVKVTPAARKPAAKGETLHAGPKTPLWNALVEDIRPLLAKRGAQAELARLLGLPRQQVNAFVTQRTRMPDAERTLLLLAWIASTKRPREERALP